MSTTLTPLDVPALITERLGKAPGLCRVFYFCDNEATTTEAHPQLGDVPCCQRCKDRLARLRQLNKTAAV